jgi:hypothetical protein
MPIKKPLFFALGTLLAASFALAQSSGAAGSLSGSITDTQGVPIPGAQVRYMSITPSVAAGLRPTPGPGETVANGIVTADASGDFSAAGLLAAPYVLCASVPSAPYLDSCVWGQPVRVTVSAGATANQTLVLQKGVFLNVRVNDPMALLPQVVDGPWTPHKLLVGVTYGTGAYQGVRNTAVDSSGHSYQLIVPVGIPFSLALYSTDVALTDANGATVAAPGAGVPFQASAGQDQNFTFTVSGPANTTQ